MVSVGVGVGVELPVPVKVGVGVLVPVIVVVGVGVGLVCVCVVVGVLVSNGITITGPPPLFGISWNPIVFVGVGVNPGVGVCEKSGIGGGCTIISPLLS